MDLPASSCVGACLRAWLLLGLAMGAMGCAHRQLEPAQEAIAAIEAALAASGTAPTKYIPGNVRRVQDELDELQRSYEQEDYARVLRDAPAVLAAARALPAEAADREAVLLGSLQQHWATLEPAIPAALEATRSRVNELTAAGALPHGVSRDELTRAAGRLDDAQALWERALAERNAQRLAEAVTLADQARELLDRVAGDLGSGAPRVPLK